MAAVYEGRLKEARRASAVAVSLARQANLPERAALLEGGEAVFEAFCGNRREAKQAAHAALALARGRDADFGPAFALALTMESAEARRIADEMEKQYPEDTAVRFLYLPAIRALIALNQGDPARAIDLSRRLPRHTIWQCPAHISRPSSATYIPFMCEAWRI